MKFLLLLAVLAVFVASSLGLKNDICGLPHSRDGLEKDGRVYYQCFARIHSWSYNAMEKTCTSFVYGGCGGNANRFESKAECEAKCLE